MGEITSHPMFNFFFNISKENQDANFVAIILYTVLVGLVLFGIYENITNKRN